MKKTFVIGIILNTSLVASPTLLASQSAIRERATQELERPSDVDNNQEGKGLATLKVKNVNILSSSSFKSWGFGFGLSENTPTGTFKPEGAESIDLQDGKTRTQFIIDVYQRLLSNQTFEGGLNYAFAYSQHGLRSDQPIRLHTLHVEIGPETLVHLFPFLYFSAYVRWGQQGLIFNSQTEGSKDSSFWDSIWSYGLKLSGSITDNMDLWLGYGLKEISTNRSVGIQRDFWSIGIRTYIK